MTPSPAPVHDAWVQAPIVTAHLVKIAREIGLGGLTLCALMPDTKGGLYARYTPSLLGALVGLLSPEFRVGLMLWADTTPKDRDHTRNWLRANRDALLACDVLEVDAEESFVRGSLADRTQWVQMFAEEVVALRAEGWAGKVSVTATDWDLRRDRIDALIRHLADLIRPQWYVFHRPGDEPHWSHQLAEPAAQIAAWDRQLIHVAMPRIGREDLQVEAGLANYWQRGVKGHDSIPSAMAAAFGAAQVSGGQRGSCAWSLNWADARGGAEATSRAAWAACLRGGQGIEALADNGEAPITPPATTPASHGDRERVRELQRRLAAAGYDPGAPDGQLGPRTRRALDRWTNDGLFAPDDWAAKHPQINALADKLGLLPQEG